MPNSIDMVSVLGPGDEHLRLIERAFDATSTSAATGSPSPATPPRSRMAERLLDEIVTLVRTGQGVTGETVERIIQMLRTETQERPADVLSLNILSNRGRTIRPKTLNQKRYVESIDKNTITFGIGPAGTGKTYLAMAKAVQALQAKEVNRIILSRPAVEAGERLGFLPGTLSEKIDPYLRPLYDALHDMVDPETIPKLLAAGTIEVAPLAFLRGRSLNDSFIILDEAQNTTPEQMKMFLTRLGFGSQDRRHRRHQPGRPAVAARSPGCGSSRASSTASRTSPSAASPPPTSYATGSSAGSWRPTRSSTPTRAPPRPQRRPTAGPPDEHRGPQRVGPRRSTYAACPGWRAS